MGYIIKITIIENKNRLAKDIDFNLTHLDYMMKSQRLAISKSTTKLSGIDWVLIY